MNKKQTLILLIAFIFFSCTKHENNSVAKRIVISGQVLNHNPQNPEVKINVNRTGLNSLKLIAELDSLGNFVAAFKSYTPTDVAIRYREFTLIRKFKF